MTEKSTNAWTPSLVPWLAATAARSFKEPKLTAAMLVAGTDGIRGWDMLTDEALVARVALSAGTVTVRDVVARAVANAAPDALGPALSSAFADADAMTLARLAPEIIGRVERGESFAATGLAAIAALRFVAGSAQDTDPRAYALEALALKSSGSSSWAPCPPALARRWKAPSDHLELVIDEALGWVGVRPRRGVDGGAITSELVADLFRDHGVAVGDQFSGHVVLEENGVQWFVVPPLTDEWFEAFAKENVDVEVSRTLIRWRARKTPPRRTQEERSAWTRALDNAIDAGCATEPLARRALRALCRNPAFSGRLLATINADNRTEEGWVVLVSGDLFEFSKYHEARG